MTTFYHSTRSDSETVTSKQAILAGIAPDGGLYVSDDAVRNKLDLRAVCQEGYHQIACRVLGTLLPDFTEQEVASCVAAAYADNFDTPAVTPLSPLGTDWLLELYHGPTCAFKDVALQMLPRLMSVARKGEGRNVMIVTATSGDTGKAALAGFAGVPGTGVTVFYPDGKVSDVQHLQMVTQTGDTIAMKNAPIMYHRPKISQPYTYKAYTAKNKGEEDKIASGLAKLMDEDLTLKTVVDAENRQSLIYGIGDQQLCRSVRYHEVEPFLRIRGVERLVGAAGLQDSE